MAHGEEEQSGLSTPQKVVAGAALGVAVPAAVGVARKLLGNGSEDEDASSEPVSRERDDSSPKQSRSTSTRSTTSRTKSATKSTTRSTANRTREQLYKTATRLKIEGRSSMNKAQLERAIARAKAR